MNTETPGTQPHTQKRKAQLLRVARLWPFALAVLLAVLLSVFVVRLGVVNGPSMAPTLHDGDVVLVWRAGYAPQPGHLVVTNRENPTGLPLTKRVAAVGGQSLRLDESGLYLDGVRQSAPWAEALAGAVAPGGAAGREAPPLEVQVPEGHIYLLGDNLEESGDSRAFGPLDARCVMGRVVLRVFPFTRFGGVG